MAVSHNYIFQNPVKFYVSSSCEKINKQKFISLSHGLHTPSCQSLAITPTNFKYLIKRALYKNYGFASHLSPCLTLNKLFGKSCLQTLPNTPFSSKSWFFPLLLRAGRTSPAWNLLQSLNTTCITIVMQTIAIITAT